MLTRGGWVMVNQDVKTLKQALHNGVIHLQKGKAMKMLLHKLNPSQTLNINRTKEKISE